MYQNVLNSVNNAAIHPWDYSWFVSIMPKNNTFTHQIFTAEWVMLILFLVAFFLYGYCIKRAWKVARLVKRIRRRIRRHSGNNPKLTK